MTMKKILLTTIVMIIIATRALTAQTTYHVKSNGGSDSNNGTSWTSAFATLQKALEKADSGDHIWVAAGTYKPTVKTGNGTENRDMAFILKSNVQIFGGFAGTETTLEQRDWDTNATILSGDLDNNGTISDGDAYHVIVSVGNVGNACLDGFRITGGNANSTDTIIVNGQEAYRNTGGGMYNFSSSPNVANSVFSGNYATFGGGVFNTTNSDPTFTNVTILANTAGDTGGGMYNIDVCAPTLTKVTISSNSAESGGGMYNFEATLTLTEVTISENTAETGGGMFNYLSLLTLSNVIVSGNEGEYSGGGIMNYECSTTLTNILISGNYAMLGGGYYDMSSSSTLINVTICGNSDVVGGGAMVTSQSPSTIHNTVVWGNSTGIYYASSSISYAHCLIQGEELTGNGNISASSIGGANIFVNPLSPGISIYGDYQLIAGSPIINLGNNTYNTEEIDLAGNPRINDGTIDIGAYEYYLFHTVTFESNGGTAIEPKQAAHGTTISAPEPPEKDNFTFNGWYKEEALTNQWDFATDVVVEDITLYAKWITEEGIKEIESNNLKIYPNPANNFVSIDGIDAGEMIIITDLNGRKLISTIASSTSETVDISGLPTGIYVISVGKANAKLVVSSR